MKAAGSCKSKFPTNLLLFTFLGAQSGLFASPCQSLEGSETKPVTKHTKFLRVEREAPAALQSAIYPYQYLCIRVHLQKRINAAGKILPRHPPLLCLLFKSLINLRASLLLPASLQIATLFNFWSEKRTGGKKPLPVLHLFYFITSLLGKWGQLCRLAICLHFLYKTILEL